MSLRNTFLLSLGIVLAGLGVLAGVTHGFQSYTSETARRLSVRAHPPAIPDVVLETADSEQIHFKDFQGQWLLVEFIYTRCLTFCSTQAYEFARLQRQLAQPIAQQQLSLLSISFDPTYDDPKALGSYLRRHDHKGPGWFATRPLDDSDLNQLKKSFGVVVIPDGIGGYLHNAAIAIVNPQGQLVEILDWYDTEGALRYLEDQWSRS